MTAPGMLITGGDDALLPHLRAALDEAERVDVAVAFVLRSGVELLFEHFRDVLDTSQDGLAIRLLTTDYLDATDPAALRQLRDLGPRLAIRAYDARRRSFHAKAWILHHADGRGVAFVGSSNLSRTALLEGVEWNYRVVDGDGPGGFARFAEAFEHLWRDEASVAVDDAWLADYERRRQSFITLPLAAAYRGAAPADPPPPPAHEPLHEPPTPTEVQAAALAALEESVANGHGAGLVVMATGLGKTFFAAFAAEQLNARRVLFVAHRREILDQALSTFRRVFPNARLGRYGNGEADGDADVLFATVQTLSRDEHLSHFRPDDFDLVVVDEFHHATAPSYTRVIDHFDPRFLLGLTATPERADGGDLLALCGEHVVYRCDLTEGIERGLLLPFRYFGVPDPVEYANIPWRSGRFDERALTDALETNERARDALDHLRTKGGSRTLCFCCSTTHANFMRDFLRREGVAAASVHVGEGSDPRASSLERLRSGDIEVLCCVDMFNEGVDVPEIDTVLMLRPTGSPTIWLQQIGRGLRRAADLDHLVVIDYVGNHRIFLRIAMTLTGAKTIGELKAALDRLRNLEPLDELPPGCGVTYDLELIDVLTRVATSQQSDAEILIECYESARPGPDQRTSYSDAIRAGLDREELRRIWTLWHQLVREQSDLSPAEEAALDHSACRLTLEWLEGELMTKCYKMVVIIAAVLETPALRSHQRAIGPVDLDRLTARVSEIARSRPEIAADFSCDVSDHDALKKLLLRYPIPRLCQPASEDGSPCFDFIREQGIFRSTWSISSDLGPTARKMILEVAEGRLEEYFRR